MINFNKEPEDKDKPKIVIYKSKEEAEAETGYFSIDSIVVKARLGDAIRAFVIGKGLVTYMRKNKRKTSNNFYTLKFTLKLYYINPYSNNGTKYGYIDGVGHQGNFKSLMKGNTFRRVDKFGESESVHYGPSSETVAKYDEVFEKTPDLKQLYFWICQKYPTEIIDMSYTRIKPSYLNDTELNEDGDFAYGDEFD